MRFGDDAPTPRLIALTPLIDVVFILLIFFMLVSSFLDWRAVDLRLAGGPSDAEAQGEVLVVRLLADGSFALNGEAVTLEEIQERVAVQISRNPVLAVIVRPEAGVTLQHAVDMLDLLKRGGATGISLSRDR